MDTSDCKVKPNQMLGVPCVGQASHPEASSNTLYWGQHRHALASHPKDGGRGNTPMMGITL